MNDSTPTLARALLLKNGRLALAVITVLLLSGSAKELYAQEIPAHRVARLMTAPANGAKPRVRRGEILDVPAEGESFPSSFPAKEDANAAAPNEVIEMIFAKRNAADHGFNVWTINDVPFSMEKMQPMFHLRQGGRYRLRMRNATDDIHPIHLHRHSFELTKIAGRPTAGIIKDVAMLGGYQEMEVDFTADQPGLSLFHCHMQLHMDYGFMALFDCV